VAVPVVKYSLEIVHSAQKELDALDDPLFARIDRKILALADDPRPVGSKKLKGYKDSWRIGVGDWRVVSRPRNFDQNIGIDEDRPQDESLLRRVPLRSRRT
jgi:mRNA interferase RelE/StbE